MKNRCISPLSSMITINTFLRHGIVFMVTLVFQHVQCAVWSFTFQSCIAFYRYCIVYPLISLGPLTFSRPEPMPWSLLTSEEILNVAEQRTTPGRWSLLLSAGGAKEKQTPPTLQFIAVVCRF